MIGLVEFLLARLNDDEDAARRAAFGYGARWTDETDSAEDWSVVHADGKRDMVGCEDPDVTKHVARWDPARVQAEIEVKLRIVDWYIESHEGNYDDEATLRVVLTRLALPYADHPDYRQDWRP